MVYGNGKGGQKDPKNPFLDLFQPFGKFDILGHELGHGVVQSFAGLIYEGHAGALNESFADILGCTFEKYIYNQFNKNEDKTDDLDGEFDWFIGEDGTKSTPLRNMKDPRKGLNPQPIEYKGQYWGNQKGVPSQQNDFLSVHTNSGPCNHSFYDFSQKVTVMKALDIYCAALKLLKTNSNYMNARDALKKVCPPEHLNQLKATLDKVGLTDAAVSDWK
jgi:Zn-dependent metalloprotease